MSPTTENRTTEVMCRVLGELQRVSRNNFARIDSIIYHNLVASGGDIDLMKGVSLAARLNWSQFQLTQDLRNGA